MTVSDIELSRFVLMCRFRAFGRELYFTDARGCACFPTIEWLKQNKSESPVMFSLSILLLIISEIISSLRIRILLLVLFLFEWTCEQIHFDGLSRTVSLWFPGYSMLGNLGSVGEAKRQVVASFSVRVVAVGKDVTLTKRFRHSSTSSGRIVTSVEHYLCMSVLLQFFSSKKKGEHDTRCFGLSDAGRPRRFVKDSTDRSVLFSSDFMWSLDESPEWGLALGLQVMWSVGHHAMILGEAVNPSALDQSLSTESLVTLVASLRCDAGSRGRRYIDSCHAAAAWCRWSLPARGRRNAAHGQRSTSRRRVSTTEFSLGGYRWLENVRVEKTSLYSRRWFESLIVSTQL